MLAIEYSMREFFNQLISVRWEWLLLVVASRYFSSGVAAIIAVGKMLASRLESRYHNTAVSDDPLLSPKIRARNSQPGPRNSRPETLNPEP